MAGQCDSQVTLNGRPCGAWAIAVLAWACFAIASDPVHAQGLPWDQLSEGLAVSLWDPREDCQDAPSMVVIRVDPSKFRFAMYQFRDEGLSAPVLIQEWQKRTSASVVLNSGLFLEDYSYLGLLLKGGRSVGGRRHPIWQGLFVADPMRPTLKPAGILDLSMDPFAEEQPSYREAAQSLMLLDRSGKPRVRRSGKQSQQTVIAETEDGNILLIKTTAAGGLWEIADCLRTKRPAIRQAIAMDGGSSSDVLFAPELLSREKDQRAAPAWQPIVDGTGQRHIPLPSVIGVFPR